MPDTLPVDGTCRISRPRVFVPLVLAFLLLSPAAALGQTYQRFGLGFRVSASAPTGVYGGNEGADAGHAQLGFGLGIDGLFRLNRELAVVASAGFVAHPPGEGLLPGDQVAFDDGAVYLLFPLLVGPRVTASVSGISAFGTIQVGAVLADGPAEHDLDESNPAPAVREGYDIPPSPSLALGGGVELGAWILGARYVVTPEAKFIANTRFPDGSLVDVETTKAIQFLDLYVGVDLF